MPRGFPAACHPQGADVESWEAVSGCEHVHSDALRIHVVRAPRYRMRSDVPFDARRRHGGGASEGIGWRVAWLVS